MSQSVQVSTAQMIGPLKAHRAATGGRQTAQERRSNASAAPLRANTSGAVRLDFDPCWFEAPYERSQQYFPAFVRVSIAVQATLRRRLQESYLAEIQRFRDTRMIYPLLVYAASRPFPGQPRTEFTYDVLNQALMHKFQLSVVRNLPDLLADVWARLRAAAMADVAAYYRPERVRTIIATVDRLKICRRRLEALLVTETLMVNHLLLFAGSGSLPPNLQKKIVAKCEKVWLSRLRRLFAKQDYTFLGPEILAIATDALKCELSATVQAA